MSTEPENQSGGGTIRLLSRIEQLEADNANLVEKLEYVLKAANEFKAQIVALKEAHARSIKNATLVAKANAGEPFSFIHESGNEGGS